MARPSNESAHMEEGARLILTTSTAVREGEKVLVVADTDTQTIGDAFLAAARGLKTDPVLATIAPRVHDGEEPPAPIAIAMESSDVVVIVTGRSLTHTHARRQATRAGARIISIPGPTEDMLVAGGLAADWAHIHDLVRRTARRLRAAAEVRVTSAGGTDLTFRVAGREWISEDTGLCAKRGVFTTLPAGELFIAPLEDSAEGRIVADLFFGEELIEPAQATVKEGRATRILGAAKAVEAMNRGGRDGRTLGRFGFGLNARARANGPHVEAEKALGVASLGFGDNFLFGGRLRCGVSVESLLSDASIEVDGKAVIEKGQLKE